MCGIVALIHPHQSIAVSRVEAATIALAHRGPDDRGVWLSASGRAALGHSRLAIIDLIGGAQPISNESRDVHAVVNGELYGYAAARASLERRGHRFSSNSDSELVVHLYEEHGERCVDLLRGEFAFALFDERTETLFAARDRFGVKPLFYWSAGGQVVLASEARALFAAGVDAEWSEDGAFQALHFAQRGHETLFRGVEQVPPGHTLSAARGTVAVRPYWRLDYPKRSHEDGRLDVGEEVREIGGLLLDAVRERTRSDVPVGCYLSGGVDSSTVLAMTQSVVSAPIRAFTIAFDHPDYDETEPAEQMARSIGAPFERIHVTSADLADALEPALEHGESLAINGHVPARFLLSRAVRDAGIKVILGGEGADELFGGYGFAQGALGGSPRARSPFAAMARFLGPGVRRMPSISAMSPLLARLAAALQLPSAVLESAESLAGVHRSVLAPAFVEQQRRADPYRRLLRGFRMRELIGREPFKIAMSLWLPTHFANYLMAAERLDMAHAVEVRLPFTDHVLFERIRALPSAHLRRGDRNKDLLRRIAAPYVTRRVLEGPKRPFLAPPGTPGDPLFARIESILRDRTFQDVPFFDFAAVQRWLDGLGGLAPAQQRDQTPLLFVLASCGVLHRWLARQRKRVAEPCLFPT